MENMNKYYFHIALLFISYLFYILVFKKGPIREWIMQKHGEIATKTHTPNFVFINLSKKKRMIFVVYFYLRPSFLHQHRRITNI